ncbi:MAG: twin-arginine translocation signal domain-containing protein [Candidatus Acetothermia bacterium]|jgi:hypothetical protein|nr:twin-arginine translocation signal domain-containing protein [Candidatus Acetothermia bacterium]MDH7505905.1 twin-arginine translocation signal domain-containing protein [Candidatus Acetothermia bacterium]
MEVEEMAHEQGHGPKADRRKFLQYLGLGGLAGLVAALTRSGHAKASPEETIQATRLAAYYNTTSDWMAWVSVSNDGSEPQQVSVEVYNLAGLLVYQTSATLSPFQTSGIALETLGEVKGKQGLVVVIPEENKRVAAFLLQRRASQPDYTAGMIALSPTSFVSS